MQHIAILVQTKPQPQFLKGGKPMAEDWVDFREIKEKISMETILAHYQLLGRFKQTSRGFRGPCPIHKGTHPNQFHVDPVKNRWNCFGGCDMQKLEGHVIGFVAAMENVSLREAALMIARWYDLIKPHPSKQDSKHKQTSRSSGSRRARQSSRTAEAPTPVQPAVQVAVPVTTAACEEQEPENKELSFQLKNLSVEHPFFAERGITLETIKTFGLGFCSKGLMKDRIVFPIHRFDGKLIGYVGRTTKEITDENPKWLLPPGLVKPKVLLNVHRVVGTSRTIILVEGGTSLLAVHQAGFPNVGALLGCDLLEDAALSYDQLRLVTTHFDEAVLLLDGDKDGREGTDQCLRQLAPHLFVRSICLPDDHDPSDLPLSQLAEGLSFLR
jgi:DNA primase